MSTKVTVAYGENFPQKTIFEFLLSDFGIILSLLATQESENH